MERRSKKKQRHPRTFKIEAVVKAFLNEGLHQQSKEKRLPKGEELMGKGREVKSKGRKKNKRERQVRKMMEGNISVLKPTQGRMYRNVSTYPFKDTHTSKKEKHITTNADGGRRYAIPSLLFSCFVIIDGIGKAREKRRLKRLFPLPQTASFLLNAGGKTEPRKQHHHHHSSVAISLERR